MRAHSLSLAKDGSLAHDEIARFSAHSGEWWDPNGPFRILHRMTPLRLDYIAKQLTSHHKSFASVRVLDVGCGGGLMAEALARSGAHVVGIDADARAIAIARRHAALEGLAIDYRTATIETLTTTEKNSFDLVLGLEILEHVSNIPFFIKALSSFVAGNGLFIAATLNRTRLSFLLAILMAENVLGWIPPQTHDWDKFLRPSELAALCTAFGLIPKDVTGVVYTPFRHTFILKKNATAINYFMTACKKAQNVKRET